METMWGEHMGFSEVWFESSPEDSSLENSIGLGGPRSNQIFAYQEEFMESNSDSSPTASCEYDQTEQPHEEALLNFMSNHPHLSYLIGNQYHQLNISLSEKFAQLQGKESSLKSSTEFPLSSPLSFDLSYQNAINELTERLVTLHIFRIQTTFASNQQNLKGRRKRKSRRISPLSIEVRVSSPLAKCISNQEILISIWGLHNLELFQCNEAFLNRTHFSLQTLQQEAQIERFYSRNGQLVLNHSYDFSKLLQSLFLRRESEVLNTDTHIMTANNQCLHILGVAKVLYDDDKQPTAILTYQRVVSSFLVVQETITETELISSKDEECVYSEESVEILDDCLPISEYLIQTSIAQSTPSTTGELNDEANCDESSLKRKNSIPTGKAKIKERQFKWYRGPKPNNAKSIRNKPFHLSPSRITFPETNEQIIFTKSVNSGTTQNACKDFKMGHKQANPWSGKTHNPFLEKIQLRQQQQQQQQHPQPPQTTKESTL